MKGVGVSSLWRVAVLGLALPIMLSGCDLLLLSPTMPGLMPGVGRPLTGKVLDSQTGLPIGKATVIAGFGSASTDNAGNFTLYGDVTGGHSVSIARAGYVTVTYEPGQITDGDTYYLDSSFSTTGSLTNRFLNVTGVLRNADGSRMTADGNISFGGATSQAVSGANGTYALNVRAGFPGNVFSGVLGGGQISGGPVQPANAKSAQPFTYQSFGYRLLDVPSIAQDGTWAATADLQVQNIPMTSLPVVYRGGLSAFAAPNPQTDVSLDFGMLGTLPVARGFATKQQLQVPNVDGAKYVIDGYVADDSAGKWSKVTITTNLANVPAAFDFLVPPKVTSPANNAQGVGGTPTFIWDPVPGAISYKVQVIEDTGGASVQPKWVGYTSGTSIKYPWFWDSDMNGAALFPQATYSLSVHALSADATTLKTAADLRANDLPSIGKFRERLYESATNGVRFSR